MPITKPVVTEETIHTAGVTYRCRSSVEAVSGASASSAAVGPAEALRAVTVSATVERGVGGEAPRSDAQAAAWPLHTRRRTLKVPPSVFLPAAAPVRRFVAPPADVPLPAAGAAAPDVASAEERAVFAAINEVRAAPQDFGRALEEAKALLVGKTLWTASGMALTLTEGAAAVAEAAAALLAAAPVPPLLSAPLPLQLAARDHALDIGRYGLVTHRSVADDASLGDRLRRYGVSSAAAYQVMAFSVHAAVEVVRQLVVDDGNAGRPRRALLRRPDFCHAGVSLAPHASHGAVCVVVLAAQLTPLGPPPPLSPRSMIARHHRVLPLLLAPPPRTCGGCWADVDPRRAVIGDRGVPYHRHCHLCCVCKSTLPDAFVCVGPDPRASLPTATSLAPSDDAAPAHIPGCGALSAAECPAPAPATATATAGGDSPPGGKAEGAAGAAAGAGGGVPCLPERRSYCPSCYMFRLAPLCDGCGAPLLRTTSSADVVRPASPADPSRPGPSELSVNGRRLCPACFERATVWMETVLDLPPMPE